MMCREAMASCRQVTRVVAIVWEPLRCIVGSYDQDAVNATCVLLAVVLKFCIAVEAHLVHPAGRVGPTVGRACIELVRPLQLETPRALELHAWTGMQQVWPRAVDPHRRPGGRPEPPVAKRQGTTSSTVVCKNVALFAVMLLRLTRFYEAFASSYSTALLYCGYFQPDACARPGNGFFMHVQTSSISFDPELQLRVAFVAHSYESLS